RRAQRRCGTGQRFKPGQRQWSVKPGTRVTISARSYTVTQVCSYRVVLEPKDPKGRTALAAAPKSCDTDGGSVDEGLRLTTNPTVLAAAAKASPAESQTLAPLNNGGVQRFPTGLFLTVSYVDTAAGTAGIGTNCAAMPVAVDKPPRLATRWSSRG
ncbi:hypothetical protein ACWDAO_41300, partial [Streptomyces sp. NPDC001212]